MVLEALANQTKLRIGEIANNAILIKDIINETS